MIDDAVDVADDRRRFLGKELGPDKRRLQVILARQAVGTEMIDDAVDVADDRRRVLGKELGSARVAVRR